MARLGNIEAPLRPSRLEGRFYRSGSVRDIERLDAFKDAHRDDREFPLKLAAYLFEHHVRDGNGMPFEDCSLEELAELDLAIIREVVDGYFRRDERE